MGKGRPEKKFRETKQPLIGAEGKARGTKQLVQTAKK